MKKIFDNFYYLYPLKKTIQFELEPLSEKKFLKEIIEKEIQLQNKKIPEFKKLFDEFLRKLINEILNYMEKNYPINEEDIKKLLNPEKGDLKLINDLIKFYETLFNEEFNKIIKGKKNFDLTTEKDLRLLLINKKEENLINLLNEFKGKVGLLKDFLLTRQNIFSYQKGKRNSLINRIFRENLIIFIKNIQKFLNNQNILVINALPKIDFDFKKYFFYTHQSIEKYNKIIAEINTNLNKINQIKKVELKKLLPLKKIPLFSNEEKMLSINSYQEFIAILKNFLENFKVFIELENPYFTILNLLENGREEFKKIFISRKLVNEISKFIYNHYYLYSKINKQINKQTTSLFDINSYLINEDNNYLDKLKNFFRKKIVDYENIKRESQKSLNTIESWLIKNEKIDFPDLEKNLKNCLFLKNEISNFIIKGKETFIFGDIFLDSEIDDFNLFYNLIRNYATLKKEKKPKININFNNSSFLTGWDINKIFDYSGGISIKFDYEKKRDIYYFIVFLDSKTTKNFISKIKSSSEGDSYFMIYRQMPDPKKDLPRRVFSETNKEKMNIKKEEYEAYERFKKYKQFKENKNDLYPKKEAEILINLYKRFLKTFNLIEEFNLQDVIDKQYTYLEEFLDDLSQRCYSLKFAPFNFSEIEKFNIEKKILLFKIQGKDFRKKKKTRDDLFTMYLNNAINYRIEKTNFKLNGQGKVFFRFAGQEPKEEVRGHKKLIVGKRFTMDKYYLHLTLSINENYEENKKELENKKFFNIYFLREINKDSQNITFLGIDRGENNLIYAVLIDQKRNLLFQRSFNEIKIGNKYVNFNEILTIKEKEKKEHQRHWQSNILIKNFKKGYLSHVLRKIIDIAYENNSLIIMENLDQSFKQIRKKIAKNIYQNFEVDLAKKLNYFVFKEKDPDEPGGIRKGLQLTPLFNSYKDITKPIFGLMIFVPAYLTSNIDSLTGFHNFFRYPKYNEIEKFMKGLSLWYDNYKDEFYLKIEGKKISSFVKNKNKYPLEFLKKDWILKSRILRSYKINNEEKEINFHLEIKDFLKDLDLSQRNIFDTLDIKKKKYFLDEIFFKLWLKLRNKLKKGDHIISPASSFNTVENPNNLPQSSDANGAYNIAVKGLILYENFIKKGKYDVEIDNQEIDRLFFKIYC